MSSADKLRFLVENEKEIEELIKHRSMIQEINETPDHMQRHYYLKLDLDKTKENALKKIFGDGLNKWL